MPDDYYVSQYSGEEIDDLLGKAGSATGAVRYDAAQSLTAAQQTQARSNIGAAPSRFGLGENLTTGPLMQVLTEETLDTTYNNGWYFANGVNIAGFSQATIRVDSSGRTIYQTAYVATADGYVLRRCLADTIGSPPYNSFGSWEWVNPPLVRGVEYRTTERYLGKPVYCKLVNFGALPNATQKVVKHNIPNVSSVISVYGSAQDQAIVVGAFGMQVTSIQADNTNVAIWTSADLSNYSAYVAMKYTKTTD